MELINKVIQIMLMTTVLTALIFCSLGSSVQATYIENSVAIADINPDDYNVTSSTNAQDAGKLQNMGNTLVGVLQVIATIASVVVLAILGIRYMLGSVEERAEYKKTMGPYLIGAIMVFGISTILGIITSVSGSLF